MRLKSRTFNYTGSAQTFVVPAGVTRLWVQGIGGGGGGGAGGAGYTTAGSSAGGSGGGGGAEGRGEWLDVTPGETVTVTVGAGGTAPAASTAGQGAILLPGGNGGNTTVAATAGTLVFPGAQKGGVNVPTPAVGSGFGGAWNNLNAGIGGGSGDNLGWLQSVPGSGGQGFTSGNEAAWGYAKNGGLSASCGGRLTGTAANTFSANTNGNGGTTGATSGSYLGGGGGGGGGFAVWPQDAGPGAGGNGGAASATAGGAGSTVGGAGGAAAGIGCGGGGGGGGGSANGAYKIGGAGGTGGPGQVMLVWAS